MRHPQLKLRMAISGSLLFGVYALVALVAYQMGFPLPAIAVATLGFVYFQYRFGRWAALKSVGAEDLPEDRYPEIHRTVEQLSDEMGIKKPRLMVAEMGVPNAFAVGRKGDGTVVISTELIQLLEFDELEGVIAHELAHIKNRDVVMMVIGQSIASIIGMAVTIILVMDEDAGFIVAWIAGNIAQMIVSLFVLAISRYREYVADSDAAEYVGGGEPLARALTKIERSAKGRDSKVDDSVSALCIFGGERGILATIFATHPSTEKRIKKLKSY